jgi:hypothetical protein
MTPLRPHRLLLLLLLLLLLQSTTAPQQGHSYRRSRTALCTRGQPAGSRTAHEHSRQTCSCSFWRCWTCLPCRHCRSCRRCCCCCCCWWERHGRCQRRRSACLFGHLPRLLLG